MPVHGPTGAGYARFLNAMYSDTVIEDFQCPSYMLQPMQSVLRIFSPRADERLTEEYPRSLYTSMRGNDLREGSGRATASLLL